MTDDKGPDIALKVAAYIVLILVVASGIAGLAMANFSINKGLSSVGQKLNQYYSTTMTEAAYSTPVPEYPGVAVTFGLSLGLILLTLLIMRRRLEPHRE